jgi:hypothetical protein
MVLIGWALLGAVLGAVGAEVLRASKPELVEKVEDAARRLVGSLYSSKSEEKSAVAAAEAEAEADSPLEVTAARPDEGTALEAQEPRKPVAEAEPPVLPDTSAVSEPGERRRTGKQQSVTAAKERRMRTKKTRPK